MNATANRIEETARETFGGRNHWPADVWAALNGADDGQRDGLAWRNTHNGSTPRLSGACRCCGPVGYCPAYADAFNRAAS